MAPAWALVASTVAPATSFSSGQSRRLLAALDEGAAGPSQPSSAAGAGEGGGDDSVACDWHHLELANNAGQWKPTKPEIKYAYDNNLKGQEIKIWWPGKTKHGECNDVTNPGKNCWFQARLLNDVGCRSENRCLHFAAHDGEPRHTYTCPTWVKNPEGVRCKLPHNWQACPLEFQLMRVDTGVPQLFQKALAKPCAAAEAAAAEEAAGGKGAEAPAEEQPQPEPLAEGAAAASAAGPGAATAAPAGQPTPTATSHLDEAAEAGALKPGVGHCLSGSHLDDGQGKVKMIFDIRHNVWYRCNDSYRCEPFDIASIRKGSEGTCWGPKGFRCACDAGSAFSGKCPVGACKQKQCDAGQYCFEHRETSKKSAYECVNPARIFLLSEGDDVAKFQVGPPALLAVLLLPRPMELPEEQRRRRRCRPIGGGGTCRGPAVAAAPAAAAAAPSVRQRRCWSRFL